MTNPAQAKNQLIADLSRDIVAEIAPQEMPMFRAISAAYFKDPEKTLESQAGKDEMLGFGAGAAATFLTPAVLAAATEVVEFVAEKAKGSVEEEGEALIGDVVKKMFKKFHPEEKKEDEEKKEPEEKEAPPPLTPEQLEKIRELAFEQARQLRLSENTAELLAESLVGSLVVPSS